VNIECQDHATGDRAQRRPDVADRPQRRHRVHPLVAVGQPAHERAARAARGLRRRERHARDRQERRRGVHERERHRARRLHEQQAGEDLAGAEPVREVADRRGEQHPAQPGHRHADTHDRRRQPGRPREEDRPRGEPRAVAQVVDERAERHAAQRPRWR
jgi:hypothetical protein